MKGREDTSAPSGFGLAAIPVALALVFHLPVLFNDLVWDDRSLILNNPRWGGPSSPLELLQRDYGLDLGGGPRGYYRPIFTLATWAIYQVGGASPILYHAVSLAMFCAGVFLLIPILSRLLGCESGRMASAMAMICAVHPLNTEGVAIFASLPDWICQLTCLALVGMALGNGRSTPGTGITGLMAFGTTFIATGFKETAYLLAGAIAMTLLAHACLRWRERSNPALAVLAGTCTGIIVAYSLRSAFVESSESSSVRALFSPEGSTRALYAIWVGARLFILPESTVFVRDIQAAPSMLAQVLGFALVAVGVAVWSWQIWRGRLANALMFAWLGAGLLNLSIATASGLPFSERYLSIIPAIYFLVLGFSKRPLHPRFAKILGAGVIAYCGAQTTLGTLKCADSVTFFASLHQDRPQEIYGLTGLADALFWDKGDFVNATRLAKQAIALKPDDPTVRTMGQLLARIAILEDRPVDALPLLDWAEQTQGEYPVIENVRADALGQLGRLDEALEANHRAIQLDSHNPAYHLQRAHLLARLPESTDDEIRTSLAEARRLGAKLPERWNSDEWMLKFRSGSAR